MNEMQLKSKSIRRKSFNPKYEFDVAKYHSNGFKIYDSYQCLEIYDFNENICRSSSQKSKICVSSIPKSPRETLLENIRYLRNSNPSKSQ